MPHNLLIAGDTHGSVTHLQYLYHRAEEYDCSAILIVGDFGYWEHTVDGVRFLDYVEALAEKFGIMCFFIDGNHENHSLLRARYMGIYSTTQWDYLTEQVAWVNENIGEVDPTPRTYDGFVKIRSGLYYIPRGSVWDWHGVKMAGLGGAYSIDVGRRAQGKSWWPEEMTTEEEVDLLKDVGHVDIFFTHDVPSQVDIDKHFAIQGRNFFKADKNSNINRVRLGRALEYVHPSLLIHGHMHLDYRETISMGPHDVEVIGLNCNDTGPASFTIIDLEDFSGN